MKIGLVEVPDCTRIQPWWESSGMLPAVFVLLLVAILATAAVLIDWDDSKDDE